MIKMRLYWCWWSHSHIQLLQLNNDDESFNVHEDNIAYDEQAAELSHKRKNTMAAADQHEQSKDGDEC